MQTITVPHSLDQKKLYTAVTHYFPTLSYAIFQKTLRKKDIRVNGKRTTENITVEANDSIAIYLSDEILFGLDIVYEDEHIVIVDKKAGVSVHDDDHTGHQSTLLSQLQKHYSGNPAISPLLCHRLDHHTGGLLIVAKNEKACEEMRKLFEAQKIEKAYHAIVKGYPKPTTGTLTHFLKKDATQSTVKVFDTLEPDTVKAITQYGVLSTNHNISRVEITLVTGRTHQIRAVFAHLGHPLIGDDKYGERSLNKELGYAHQLLWAVRLCFHTESDSLFAYLNEKCFEVNAPF